MKRFASLMIFSACIFCCRLFAQAPAAAPAPPPTYAQQAAEGVQAMQKWYEPGTGLYRTTGWWNSANATTVLVNYSRISADMQYRATLANTFDAAQKTSKGFLNDYYDDEGWWALPWIDAYELTREPR